MPVNQQALFAALAKNKKRKQVPSKKQKTDPLIPNLDISSGSSQSSCQVNKPTTVMEESVSPIHPQIPSYKGSHLDIPFMSGWSVQASNMTIGEVQVTEEMGRFGVLPRDRGYLTRLPMPEFVCAAYHTLETSRAYSIEALSRLDVMGGLLSEVNTKIAKLEAELIEKEESLKMWERALAKAKDDVEREKTFLKADLSKKTVAAMIKAVDDYKLSAEFEEEKVQYSKESFKLGFELCKAEISKAFPELNLDGVDIPEVVTEDEDGGDEVG